VLHGVAAMNTMATASGVAVDTMPEMPNMPHSPVDHPTKGADCAAAAAMSCASCAVVAAPPPQNVAPSMHVLLLALTVGTRPNSFDLAPDVPPPRI
jgi:hypothetical protein